MTFAKLHQLRRSWTVVTWTVLLGCAPQRFQSMGEPKDDSSDESRDAWSSSNSSSTTSSSADSSEGSPPPVTSKPVAPGASSEPSSNELSDVSIRSEAASTTDEGESVTDGPSDSSPGSTTPPSHTSSDDSNTSDTDVQTSGSDECANQRTTCRCAPAPQEQCETLKSVLTHHFSFVFDGGDAPSKVQDWVGNAEATLTNAFLNEHGVLQLDGQEAYVQLPPKLVSGHEELTLDIWTEWSGGAASQRMLSIGRAPRGPATPDHYLTISPSDSRNVLSVQYQTNPMRSGDRLELDTPLPTNSLQHLTLVIRPDELQLYLNGELAGRLDTVHRLTSLDDAQFWLGRALSNDRLFYAGTLHEFRVFGRALSADEIRYAHDVGFDLPRE